MKVWFMYDCHVFAKVGDGSTSREAMMARAKELFAEDGCGSIFACDVRDREIAHAHGHPQTGPLTGWGISDDALNRFFDKCEEHANWEARG